VRVDTLQVPEGVRLVIGRRLQRLSESARRVLTTAAVIGRTFSLSLLEALETRPRTRRSTRSTRPSARIWLSPNRLAANRGTGSPTS
jgi:hypothetical protein